ncbi:hypothetical protein M569_01921 [Genlisea aurea]|uniref:TOD1/MUCI70 glycosyltransferase-like domain-containing protein n=1 Tax=Genlisea aurea TaxID=192259 RepID=S8CZE5_9LAMI|nr:hypothetical protein M569_01921 [Genlisea aurea]
MASSVLSAKVSNEDPEDPPGQYRIQVPRKRRRLRAPRRFDSKRHPLAVFCSWWQVLVVLLAAALLIYEAFKLGGFEWFTPSPLLQIEKAESGVNRKSRGSLDRLEPTTRVFRGVRQPCLKLLPPEELELLDIPEEKESHTPVKKLVYLTEPDGNGKWKFNSSEPSPQDTRFNSFTGFQTLDQRNRSFQVTERAEVPCGFYSEAGGFRISDDDRSYMQMCKVVVSTCAFGGGDDLYQPIGMTNASLQKVCYVAFWDEITLAAQESVGIKVDPNHFIGKWRIVIVNDLPFRDQRLNGKIPKMLPHRLFPNARYSIWVDSKSQFRRDPLGVLEALLWRSNQELGISEHGARSSVYDEAKAVVKKNKARPEEVDIQIAQYRLDGLPEDKRLDGKKALSEASIILRKHSSATNLFACLWFNEVVRFTSRDQLSFPYVRWRLKGLVDINMFPVCIRKDMVNSIGHVRKAKPLFSPTVELSP